ncbi:hypothetical protein IFR05_010291 [Cadophora sp. M221]|nr:hypothetical protein IFR05_010291 [Cadophora sp. M221]
MSSKSSHTESGGPAVEGDAAAQLPGQQRIGPAPSLRPKPVALRPAPATGSQESEKEIRKRLMQGIPKARRWVIRNRIELTLPPEFSQPPSTNEKALATTHAPEIGGFDGVPRESSGGGFECAPSSEHAVGFEAAEAGSMTVALPSPLTILGAGRVDPFGNYPIRMSYDEKRILDQVNTNTWPIFKTFKNSWLPTAMQDPATFHQFLANVSLNLYHIQGQTRSRTVSAQHYAIALRTVNIALSDPARNTADGIIASIVTFVCYCVTQNDLPGYDVHIEGLEKIIRLRGGLQTLDHSPTLRCMVFGVDLSGACRRDSKPTFPPPDRLIKVVQSIFRGNLKLTPNHVPTRSPRPWANAISQDCLLTNAFDDLLKAINYTRIKAARGEDWLEVRFVVFWIDPIVHNLLGQGPETQPTDGLSVVLETTRVGLILFLFKLRRVGGQLGVSTTFFIAKLRRLASTMAWKILWDTSERLLLWVLFVGMLESQGTEDEDWFAETTAMAAHWMGMKSWDATLAGVKEFPWIDGLFEDECERSEEKFKGIMDSLEQDVLSPWPEISVFGHR